MAMARYNEAALSYRFYREGAELSSPDSVLCAHFNEAESERRASGKIHSEEWQAVAELFENVRIEAEPLEIQANMFQAMHIPSACLGRIEVAMQLLARSQRCAAAIGKAETIFCAKTYSYLPSDEFMAVNEEMAAALKAGQLWDGMPLPTQPADPM